MAKKKKTVLEEIAENRPIAVEVTPGVTAWNKDPMEKTPEEEDKKKVKEIPIKDRTRLSLKR